MESNAFAIEEVFNDTIPSAISVNEFSQRTRATKWINFKICNLISIL